MKVIRVPWIQCRADEAGAECFPMEWRGKDFEIMAYNEREARAQDAATRHRDALK